MRNPSPDRQRVASFLDELLRNLQEDPLRKPYLANEVINLAGLIYRSRNYGRQELEECEEILDRAEKKMREMDRYLIEESGDWQIEKPRGWHGGASNLQVPAPDIFPPSMD